MNRILDTPRVLLAGRCNILRYAPRHKLCHNTRMLVLDCKLYGSDAQFALIDEAIRTAQFIRNKCLRHWMDEKKVGKYDLSKLCAVLSKEFEWAGKLNSMARQASAERAWAAISRFFDNCKKQVSGKKGYPKFKKDSRSVEYKTSGWKLSDDRTAITLTDGFKIGTLKIKGSISKDTKVKDLAFYTIDQIKRIRLVRRADGYYVQFCISVDRTEEIIPTGKTIGLDMGLESFYTDSNGEKIDNPRFLSKSEKALKRAQRKVSRKFIRTKKGEKKQRQSNNYLKAKKALSRKHLKVSRQRKDFAAKTARCVILSNDVVAIEDLKVRNMVKNHHLAKSISDASWSMFRDWLEYFGRVYGRLVIAVSPHYTSQECSSCHAIVKKSLSTRTHICKCGCVLDRDENAAINILNKALRQISTEGHSETASLELEIALGEMAATTPEKSAVASQLIEQGTPPYSACT
jgi:putative transposase